MKMVVITFVLGLSLMTGCSAGMNVRSNGPDVGLQQRIDALEKAYTVMSRDVQNTAKFVNNFAVRYNRDHSVAKAEDE